VKSIFEAIFNDPERQPIRAADTGAFSNRGNTSSLHNYGLAIDINWNANYFIRDGRVIAGSHWKPGEDVFSLPPNGSVVRAFREHGWFWGGHWTNPIDYMHFGYINH